MLGRLCREGQPENALLARRREFAETRATGWGTPSSIRPRRTTFGVGSNMPVIAIVPRAHARIRIVPVARAAACAVPCCSQSMQSVGPLASEQASAGLTSVR